MPEIQTTFGSEYNQASFIGGMNLLLDDTRLSPNQYRVGFDLTNRFDALDPVLSSEEDLFLPKGVIQEVVTFGNYVIAFVSGSAYYRYYTDTQWRVIESFTGLATNVPRYWTCAIPVGLTNYVRFAKTTSANGGIDQLTLAGSAKGSLPGLLVQDNINQPMFIYLDGGFPVARITQSFDEWRIGFTTKDNVVVGPTAGLADVSFDLREYVPIGNCMAWANGILFMVSPDTSSIYRSVSGRPLDFVVNVTNALQDTNTIVDEMDAFWQVGGGDATTTAYSVGVGGISCIRPLATGGIFVSASNANFAVTLDRSNISPLVFGEFTFNRAFLFNATCLSDRAVIDTIGDTRFVELTGIRSFNAISQTANEGRNSSFSSTIQGAFGTEDSPLIQDATASAAILYNEYELYSVKTIFGNVIAKYDTKNNCWVSLDIQQVGGSAVKIFAKIELTILRLYAATVDNRLFTLYVNPITTKPYFRSIGVCASIINSGTTVKLAQPKLELKLQKARAILNKITENTECSFTPYFNNRQSSVMGLNKSITFEESPVMSTDSLALPDVDTQLMNLLWSTPDAEQCWKCFGVFTWTGGSFTQFSFEFSELTPNNPEYSQGLTI